MTDLTQQEREAITRLLESGQTEEEICNIFGIEPEELEAANEPS